jgi:hypothetical protein
MIEPDKVFPQAGHQHDGVVSEHIPPFLEENAIDDIEMIILELAGGTVRFEMETLLTNILQRIVPRLQHDERRGIRRRIVNQLAANPNGKVEAGRLKRRVTLHAQ